MENIEFKKAAVGTVLNETLDFMVKDLKNFDCDTFCAILLVQISIRPLPGFENCHAADIVQNFFIARTLTAGRIRFDGLFKQIAHREYFLDAIGKLRIAVW